MQVSKFHWADYLIFVLNLMISAGIGFFHGFGSRKQKTTKDFLVGGRTMKPLPVALSLLASFLSAPFLMGGPAEIYCYGTVYGMLGLGFILVCICTAETFVPVFHKLELTSAYEVNRHLIFLKKGGTSPTAQVCSMYIQIGYFVYNISE